MDAMISLRLLADSPFPADRRAGLLEGVLIAVGGVAIAFLILVPEAALLAVLCCLAVGFVWVASSVFHGRVDGVLLWWAAVFPLGYYFISFPREQAIITLDRLVAFLAFAALVFGKRDSLTPVPKALRNA